MTQLLMIVFIVCPSFFLGSEWRVRHDARKRRQLRELQIRQQYIDELKAAKEYTRPFDWSVDL